MSQIMSKKLWRVWNELFYLGNGWHSLAMLDQFDSRDITELNLRGAIEYSSHDTWRLLDLKKFKTLNQKGAAHTDKRG